MTKFLLLTGFVLSSLLCSAQLLNIEVAEHRFRIDPYNNIIVVQMQNLDAYSDLSPYSDIELELLNFEFSFVTIPNNLEFTGAYTVNNGSEDYSLFFTTLPLLKIQSQENIEDEPKIPAEFSYADEDQIIISTIGIEKRGAISQSYPKKTYDIEFWEDETGEVKVDVQIGDMRNDDDWILDGLYNEPLRIRAHSATELWQEMHEPHYIGLHPNAKAGTKSQYVELFLNGRYSGIYLISEQVDRKLLEILPFEEEIEGELYKGDDFGGNTTFEALPDFDNNSIVWGDYEKKYPDDTTNWQNLYDFTDFVMNSSETEFEDIWNRFSEDNYIDYFIFLNTIRAGDNIGKNIYTARYSSETPYFYVPWDLDGCFGTKWDGTNWNITDDILGNNFHERVINSNVNDYWNTVRARWYELRPGILHPDSLIARLDESFQLLKANNVYTRESMVFPNYPFDQESFDYAAVWINERVAFLDIYFGYNPTSVTENSASKLKLYPNPIETEFQIDYKEGLSTQPYQIIDLSGKVIVSATYNGNPISVYGIEKGLYIFKLGSLTEKIIIQ